MKGQALTGKAVEQGRNPWRNEVHDIKCSSLVSQVSEARWGGGGGLGGDPPLLIGRHQGAFILDVTNRRQRAQKRNR